MNSSRTEAPKKEPQKKKNIREIYLQALKHSKGFKKQSLTKKGISNITNEERNSNFSGSNFLEKEYHLVQRIISDTKELKSIKIKNESNKTDSVSQITTRQIVPQYKSQEEYYQEVIELKKSLKLLKNNEIITKAKFEYYENEMVKKEQEILDLLDVKKSDVVSIAESKTDSSSLIYSLKQKAYKLEFALKRKDNELNKLKNELKLTNLKEIKLQNERLRVELANALTHDRKIIEVFDKKGVEVAEDGTSFYDSDKHKTLSAKQLQGDIYDDSSEFISKFPSHEKKIVLKGTLAEKLEQLDRRETELLNDIEKLKEELEYLKRNVKTNKRKESVSEDSDTDRKASSRESLREKENEALKNITSLQSIMRAHLQRINSLNRDNIDINIPRRSPSPLPQRQKSPRELSPTQNYRLRRKDSFVKDNYRFEKNIKDFEHDGNSDYQRKNEYGKNSSKSPSRRKSYESDEERLIPEKKPEIVDSSCCSCGNKKEK